MPYLRLIPVFALLFGLAFASCQSMRAGQTANSGTSDLPENGCGVAYVLDGDTLQLICPEVGELRARLVGFDAPEIFEPSCPREAELGRRAAARMRTIVENAASIEPEFGDVDKFGRRLVQLRVDGRDVGDNLIAEGLAVPYSGGPRSDWCGD